MKASIAPTKLHIDVIERYRDTSRRRGSDDASSNGRQNLLPSVFDVGDIPLADSNRARERFLGQLQALPDGSDVVLHAPILAPLFADSNSAARCQLTSATHNQHMTSRKAKIEPVHIEEAANLRRLFDNREAPRLTQAAFGEKFEIGSQAVVWQYLNARIPLNLEKAARFAKGLNCEVADFSPRLAEEMQEFRENLEQITQALAESRTRLQSQSTELKIHLQELRQKTEEPAENPGYLIRGYDASPTIGTEVAQRYKEPTSTDQQPSKPDPFTEVAEDLTNAIRLLLMGGGINLNALGGRNVVFEQIKSALQMRSASGTGSTTAGQQAASRNLSWSDSDLDVAIEPLIPKAAPKLAKKQRAGATRKKA